MKRRVIPSLALLVFGCTGHGSESHRAELSKFIGMSETELVRQLGQPDSSSGDVSQQFIVFNNVNARYVDSAAGYRYDHDYPPWFRKRPGHRGIQLQDDFCDRERACPRLCLTGNGCR